MADSDIANPRVRDDHRRVADKLWDWAIRFVSALLTAVALFAWGKVDGAEKRLQALETRSALLEASKESTGQAVIEIKQDIREIRNKLEVRRNP